MRQRHWDQALRTQKKVLSKEAELENKIHGIYEDSLNYFIQEYAKLVSPHIKDGEIDFSRVSKKHVAQIQSQIRELVKRANRDMINDIENHLREAYGITYKEVISDEWIKFSAINQIALEKVLKTPWTMDGVLWSERI